LSNHTLQTEKRGIRGRRIVVFGVSLPVIPVALTVLGAGVALAAVLLTTTVGGTLTIKTAGTANNITVTGSAENGSALDCSSIDVKADQSSITLKPVLTKTQNGGNATSTDPVPGGTCTLKFAVKNNSTNGKNIRVDATQTKFDNLPKGIKLVGVPGGEALAPIAPGATAELTVTLEADATADGTGSFNGNKIVYTDA
jgi:hypothetical protein